MIKRVPWVFAACLILGVAVSAATGSTPAEQPAVRDLAVVSLAEDPVIFAAGDIACDPSDPNYFGGIGSGTRCRARATGDVIEDQLISLTAPAAVLDLGDTQYECGAIGDFQQSYDASWGRFKSITNPVPGNHEYKAGNPNAFGDTECTKNASGYFAYFGALARDPAAGYYSFNLGGWHLIGLNTNSGCSKVSCGQGSVQEQWLRADLAANTQPCTLAYWHQPAFSSKGDSANALAFWQDLYAAHADLVVNGHVHGYERFTHVDPNGNPDAAGIREIVAGTGGEGNINFKGITRLGSQAQNGSTFGVLKLTLHPSSYDFEFLPIAGSSYTDSGSGTCHPK